ncbi:MAG: CHASE3 domain-containing protein [Burkholderiaceae bacterium]|nr:CHASE3 domain-containing protein [Burkholderiaceae bacterium]
MREPAKLQGHLVAVIAAGLAAVLVLVISETSHWSSRTALAELGEISAARIHVQRLLLSVTDAETAQRGYLLTGRKEYVEPYAAAMKSLPETREWLRRHYAGRDVLEGAMTKLDELVAEKLSELELVMNLYESGRLDAAREVLLSNIGKERMDVLRTTSEAMLADEARGGEATRQRITSTLLLNRVGVAVMTALSLMALLLYLRSVRALDVQRARQQSEIQAERDQLEVEVARRTAELTILSRHLLTAREDERAHLARELHDELGALLTAAKLDVARIKTRITALSPEAGERLVHLAEMLNSGISLKRRIIEDLRPSSLANLGLVAALRILAEEFGQRSEIRVACDLQPVHLPPTSELTVYRLVQEALTNIAKHAHAHSVHVTLGERDGKAAVEVRDDGEGFDPRQVKAASSGLLGMRFRVEAEGGELQLRSTPGQGTSVIAALPLQGDAELS